MAEKKIFTSLAFQSGAKLVAPKVEARTPLATLTDPTDSNYYTGSAGQLAYNNGNIWVNNDSIWTKLLNHATTATISGEFTFDRVDGNNAGIAPFIIGSNSNNVLVTGLNADKLDGYDARNALNDGTTHSIPRRDDDNLFHVGASSYTESAYDSHGDTQVANKALVAAGIAKLVNSAPAALDTLEELAGALGDDAAFSTTVNTALGNRLRIDVNNQGLTSTELTNARTNLGLGALATLDTVGASEITDGSVDTAELADDAVDADKLDDSATFTMGGLTVNGGSTFNNTLTISSVGLVTWDTDNFKIRSQSGRGLQLGSGGTHGYMTLSSTGSLGIGADTPSAPVQIGSGTSGNTNSDNVSLLLHGDSSGGAFLEHNRGGNYDWRVGVNGSSHYEVIGAGTRRFLLRYDGSADFGTTSDPVDVKVTGGLGIGTVADGLALNVLGAAGTSATNVRIKGGGGASDLELIGNQGNVYAKFSETGTNDPGQLQLNAGGSAKILFSTNSTSYFNGGKVAIGGTTARSLLHVGADVSTTADATSATAFIKQSGATSYSGLYMERSGQRSGYYMGVSSGSDDGLEFARNNAGTKGAVLGLTKEGVHNHYANSIVNSATVAGLQDGACYDFNGANTNHIALPTAAYDAVAGDRITVAAWIKRTSDSTGSGVYDGIVSVDGLVNQAEGFALLIDGANEKLFWQYDSSAAQIDSNDSGGQVLALNKWYHVVGIYDGSNLKTYVNGVLDRTQSGAGKALSGTNKTIVIGNQGTNSSSYFRGQIRDVKIFPSALDAADIRKLYSGENPKKNDNVEFFDSAASVFTSGTYSWVAYTGNSISNNSNQLVITRPSSGGDSQGAYLNLSDADDLNSDLTVGSTYMLTVDAKASGGSPNLLVYDGSSANNTSTLTSSMVTYRIVFTAGHATNCHIKVANLANGQTVTIDNLSLVEVGTLVDFTPQSASSSKWRNEAIPALYNGTVNNATLSAGYTHHSPTHLVDGDKASFGDGDDLQIYHDGSHSIITDNGTGDLHLRGNVVRIKNAAGTENMASFLQDGEVALAYNNSTKLNTENTGVKVTGNLGIGVVAGTPLHVSSGTTNNLSDDLSEVRFIGADKAITGEQANLVIQTNDAVAANKGGSIGLGGRHTTDSTNGANFAQISGRKENATSGNFAGYLAFSTAASGSDIDERVRITSIGNVGVNSSDPQALLDINSTANTGYPLLIRGDLDANGRYTGIKFGLNGTGATNNYFKAAIQVRATTGHVQPDMHFMLEPAASWTSVEDSDAHRVLSLRNDGTHDHQGNRIVNSQTVNDSWRSSEPSLRFDGSNDRVSVASNSALDFSGNFTISAWIKLKDYTSNTTQAIVHRQNGGIRYYMAWRGNSNDIIQVAINGDGGSNYDINSATNAITDNGWHHVVATIDRGVNNHRIYIDGVQSGSTATGGTTGPINPDAPLMIGSNGDASDSFFDGEIRDVRIHNRALDADEVKGLYNGESTPWKYADAGANLVTGGDMEDASDLGTAYGVTLTQSNTVAHSGTYSAKLVDTGGSSGKLAKAFTAEAGKTYRVSGYYYPTSDMGNARLLIQDTATWASPIADTSSGSTFANIQVSYITANQWNYVSAEWTATSTYNGTLYASWCVGDDANDTGTAYWDDVEVVQIGEVAAYTPKSINDKWYDETSNANHGTISGATTVGDIDHFGILTVKGRSVAGDDDNNTAGCIKLGHSDDKMARFDYDPASTSSLRIDNTHDDDSAEIEFGLQTSGTRVIPMQLLGDGTVKARSANSSNLKQVARVHVQNITGTGSATQFHIQHNLGTKYVTVSVREHTSSEHVEVHTSTLNSQGNADSNNVRIAFATAPVADKVYYVTVIG